uniref:F-box domain-containing protein n=1 Tax=Caenorhabditis tropicalis TaxID=1561998 RepID=A0A1I7U6F7_9PELO
MSTKSQFPLLKLPWVALEYLLNNNQVLDIFDLINFSFISKRCYRIVKLLKQRELRAYDVKIRSNFIDIDFIKAETKVIARWKFNLGEEWKTNPFMQICYATKTSDYWVPARALHLLTDDPVSTAVNSFRYLMDLFPRPVDDIIIDLDGSNQSKRIIKAFGIDQCEILRINNKNKMSKSDVIEIMKTVKIKESICFDVDLESGFPYENGMILPPRVHLSRGQATREMIFRMKSPFIFAWDCEITKITPDDFNDFAIRWYNSTDTSFQTLVVNWNKASGNLTLNIATYFDLHKYDEKRRGRYVRSELEAIGRWKFNLGEEFETKPLVQIYDNEGDDWVLSKAVQLLTDDPESSVVTAFRYLMALFPRPVWDFTLNLDEFNQSERIYRLLGILHCEVLRINGKNKMSKIELLEIMKVTKVNGSITLNVDLEPGFPYGNDLPPRTDFLRGQATRKMIFQLNLCSIFAWSCELSKITPNDFIDFVMRWYNSNDTSFQMLLVNWTEASGDVTLNIPLDIYAYDEKRRGRYVRLNRKLIFDTSIGMDIQRKDGLWATIATTPNSKSVIFNVWHCSSTDFIFNGVETCL